jgi:hypothetical protein
VKIRKVSASILDQRPVRSSKLSPRERKRRALDSKLEIAVRATAANSDIAFRVDLDQGDKLPTVRAAFYGIRERTGAAGVNIFTKNGVLFIANRPQTRGRRRCDGGTLRPFLRSTDGPKRDSK